MLTSSRFRLGLSPRWAALLGSLLCLPFVFLMVTATLNMKPSIPFEHLLFINGYQPTVLGRVVMLGMLGSLPVAFIINLIAMLPRDGDGKARPFSPSLLHAGVGLALLILVWIAGSEMALNELRPFVARLGAAAPLGRVAFSLAVLALPAAFLLNRLPRLPGRAFVLQPTSINLILGAVALLLMLIVASAITLETIACASGVPNCD